MGSWQLPRACLAGLSQEVADTSPGLALPGKEICITASPCLVHEGTLLPPQPFPCRHLLLCGDFLEGRLSCSASWADCRVWAQAVDSSLCRPPPTCPTAQPHLAEEGSWCRTMSRLFCQKHPCSDHP